MLEVQQYPHGSNGTDIMKLLKFLPSLIKIKLYLLYINFNSMCTEYNSNHCKGKHEYI